MPSTRSWHKEFLRLKSHSAVLGVLREPSPTGNLSSKLNVWYLPSTSDTKENPCSTHPVPNEPDLPPPRNSGTEGLLAKVWFALELSRRFWEFVPVNTEREMVRGKRALDLGWKPLLGVLFLPCRDYPWALTHLLGVARVPLLAIQLKR